MAETTPECDNAYFIRDYRILPNGTLQELGLLEEITYDGWPIAGSTGQAWIGPLILVFHLRNLPIGFHRPQLAVQGEAMYFWEFMPWIQIEPKHQGEFTCIAHTVFPARVTNLPFTTTYEVRMDGEPIGSFSLRVVSGR